MTENEAIFKAKATIKSADIEHRQKINFNIGKYNKAVPNGELQFADLNLAKERAKNIKWRALETLDQHLEEFEMQFSKRGGNVIWAQNSQEPFQEILAIFKEKKLQDDCEEQKHGHRRDSSKCFFGKERNRKC
jgi:L-lactate dehydrogenase complex protein LldF